jgi:hypothetical protein
MVWEEVVEYNSENNALVQGAGETGPLTAKDNFERGPHPDVPVGQLCTSLLKKRKLVGAHTPEGRRLSRMNELLLNRKTAIGDQLANINKEMAGLLDYLQPAA